MTTKEWIDYCQSRIDDIQDKLNKQYAKKPMNYEFIDMLNEEYHKWVSELNTALKRIS